MADERKPEGVEGESSQQPESTRRGGGMIFPAIVILVLAAWCFRDGFLKPDATSSPLFNRIGAVVLGLGGLGMLGYELLRPRSAAGDKSEENKNSQDGS